MTKLDSLSIIIPLYNNEKTLEKVITEAVSEGKKHTDDLEVLVLDDGSSDKSVLLANKSARKYKNVKILRHSKNLGFGITIKSLYESSSKSYIFSIPGDHQIRANVLGGLTYGLREYDMVIGKRSIRQDSLFRVVQSKVYNKLLNVFFNLDTTDVNSAKLFRKKIIDAISLTSESAFVDGELCIKAKRAGFRIGEVEIEHFPDYSAGGGGGKAVTVWKTIGDFLGFIFKT